MKFPNCASIFILASEFVGFTFYALTLSGGRTIRFVLVCLSAPIFSV